MIRCIRTNSDNKDFQQLVSELDTFLRIHDGEDHSYYSQFNKIDTLKHVIVACDNDIPVGCGAIKQYSHEAMEVKRMYVLPNRRGEGIAAAILQSLEQWTVELHLKKCMLETGKQLLDAVALYKKNGYVKIPNYGQYKNIENSACFEKLLSE